MIKLILGLLIAASLNAEIYDGVAVVVEEKAITLLDIKKEMQKADIDAKKAMEILIRKKLESLEIEKRGISVTSLEIYEDIKKMAKRNNMTLNEFYDAVRQSNGLSSEELKEKIKEKILSQKLYSAIAMKSMDEPSEEEIKEYFKLHKNDFNHPLSFDVIVYETKEREILEKKVANPMFYSPQITSNEQTLSYDHISLNLAKLLQKTKAGSFTPIVPNGKGGFMSFYIKSLSFPENIELKNVRAQIINTIMAKKRETILSDYFARLRDNADINIIRVPKS